MSRPTCRHYKHSGITLRFEINVRDIQANTQHDTVVYKTIAGKSRLAGCVIGMLEPLCQNQSPCQCDAVKVSKGFSSQNQIHPTSAKLIANDDIMTHSKENSCKFCLLCAERFMLKDTC